MKADEQAALNGPAAMPDRKIDTLDMPEVTDWSGAIRGGFDRPLKALTSGRLDEDLSKWFKRDGKG